ncbi:hypothetical protein Agau_P100078 (plasmid) [Agrobacterium tumefaciens F2]|nr:hypothetical protein Agau_P100078 [Agrobacterium tumefaciens F2]
MGTLLLFAPLARVIFCRRYFGGRDGRTKHRVPKCEVAFDAGIDFPCGRWLLLLAVVKI